MREVAGRVGSGDDMAFLIVRSCGIPARMDIEFSADPAALAGLRRRLRSWLVLRGCRRGRARGCRAGSISEACNNAIEHGYRGQPGTIRLIIDHSESELRIVVEDRGNWRPPVPDPERGLGLEIMRSVMREASLEHHPGGTRVLLSRPLTRPSRIGA